MAAPKLPQRLRILRTLEKEPHRYPKIRRFTMLITFATLYAIPLLGAARFDLWAGHHLAWGKQTNFVYGFGAVFLSIVAFYLATFIVNGFVGRLFCGFGCPVGEASRVADAADITRRTGEGRLKGEAKSVGYSAALAGAAWLWLCDPRVFLQGTPKAIGYAIGGFVGGTALMYAISRYVRWRLCQGWCPIGIYYSIVRTAHSFGIHYDEIEGTCKDCDYCAQACPVDLNPRDLEKPQNEVHGVAIEGLPQANHCLTCGECVRACEDVISRKPGLIPPLRLSQGVDKRRPESDLPKPFKVKKTAKADKADKAEEKADKPESKGDKPEAKAEEKPNLPAAAKTEAAAV
ncbi:MAG: 4Fe-4S dicluster domain-containing protein [Polyangiaceae bacterium]